MTVTPRDRVWLTVLALLDDRTGVSARVVYGRLQESIDDPDDVPSRRTVRNTLDAMAELGLLEILGGDGRAKHYVKASQ